MLVIYRKNQSKNIMQKLQLLRSIFKINSDNIPSSVLLIFHIFILLSMISCFRRLILWCRIHNRMTMMAMRTMAPMIPPIMGAKSTPSLLSTVGVRAEMFEIAEVKLVMLLIWLVMVEWHYHVTVTRVRKSGWTFLLEMVKGKFCRHIQYGLLKNI